MSLASLGTEAGQRVKMSFAASDQGAFEQESGRRGDGLVEPAAAVQLTTALHVTPCVLRLDVPVTFPEKLWGVSHGEHHKAVHNDDQVTKDSA